MPKENEKNVAAAPVEAKDRIGDILRKERITRRITVETIAKDLKLNVNYIKALESSEYDALPADPYVRVYLRSLTKYLSLDSDSILQEFYKERGVSGSDYRKDNKIEISMRKYEEKKNPTLAIAAVLIVMLALFAFVANQKGWITTPEEAAIEIEDKTDAIIPVSIESGADSDSLVAALATPEVRDTSIVKRQPPRP
ncbi:MAG: helix-turn-helix domain-containing protein [Chitinispirillales bacterium]|jgi:cytoskeletal protein RodZ|nr:helix-turn-helix domain-containing protein [Chitinispirillales bacterium]